MRDSFFVFFYFFQIFPLSALFFTPFLLQPRCLALVFILMILSILSHWLTLTHERILSLFRRICSIFFSWFSISSIISTILMHIYTQSPCRNVILLYLSFFHCEQMVYISHEFKDGVCSRMLVIFLLKHLFHCPRDLWVILRKNWMSSVTIAVIMIDLFVVFWIEWKKSLKDIVFFWSDTSKNAM